MASCPSGNFSSITDILSQADAGDLNVTDLVQSCSQICSLAWGTGNPDLSGIGANVSYILQAVLTCIFGPIFVLIYSLVEDALPDFVAAIVSLQIDFIDASAGFTIPVAVGAIVRLKQDAPFYEITFLQSLLTMQFLGLLAVIAAVGVVDKELKKARITLLVLYALLNFGFYLGIVGRMFTSKASYGAIKELANACQGYGNILPFVGDPETFVSTIAIDAHNPKLAIFELVIIGAGAVAGFGELIYFSILRSRGSRPSAFVLGAVSLFLTVTALYELAQMEHKRSIIKALAGSSFEDNAWGFGQVLSLFLWVPLFIQAIGYFTGASDEPESGSGTRQQGSSYKPVDHGQRDDTRQSTYDTRRTYSRY